MIRYIENHKEFRISKLLSLAKLQDIRTVHTNKVYHYNSKEQIKIQTKRLQ